MAEVGQPQLRMQVSLGSLLHAAVVPSGYRVSVLESSRLPDWIAVLNSVGDLGEWSEQRALQAVRRPLPASRLTSTRRTRSWVGWPYVLTGAGWVWDGRSAARCCST